MRIPSCLVRGALLQQAILITLVDLALSNVSDNSMKSFFSQQISSKHPNNNNLTTLSLPQSQLQASTKSLAQPILNESLDAGYELTRIDEPIKKSHVEKIKSKGRNKVNARKGRKANTIIHNDSFADDNNSDAAESDEQQQIPVVSKEGVAQANRAARNVERKMNVISGRLNQIQSRIAEDHQQAVVSNSTPVYGEYSTPYNGDQDNIDSSSMREFGSNDKATDLPSVSSPSSGMVNNIEAPTQSQTSDPNWMNGPLNDGDDQIDNSNRLNQNIIRNESNHSFKWSPPIIKSVIPGLNGRQDLSSSSSENSNSNTIGNELSNQGIDSMSGDQSSNSEDNNSEHNNNSNDLQPVTKIHPPPKPHHHHHRDQDHLTKPNSHTLTGSLSNDLNILGFENALIGGGQNAVHQITNNNKNLLNTTRYSNQLNSNPVTTSQASPISLLGPEWKTNEGLGTYQHFLELNSKNHNNNKDATAEQQTLDSLNKNGGVAFKVAPSLRASITNKNGGRFQNMTILNSESDLLNSFSNQQQQHHHHHHHQQQPMKMMQSPSMATAATTTTTTSTTTKRPESSSKKQPNSVHTYTASNYGRGSKENAQRSVTVQPVLLPDSYDKAQDGSSFSDAYLTPTMNRNDTTDYLNQPPSIRWPEFATSYTSSTTNGNENNLNNNNHHSKNNHDVAFPVSKMLTSAATNNNRYSPSLDSGESDTVQAGNKLVDMDSMMSNNLGNDMKSNMQRISNTAQSNVDEQIIRPARTSSSRLHQHDNQGLNPSQLSSEMYNLISRRQHIPDSKDTFPTFSTKTSSPTNLDESVIANSSNNSSDLKHRSSSNSDDISLSSYPSVDSAYYSQNRNPDQMNLQNAFNDNFQASQSNYQNPSDGSPDYSDAQTSYSRNANNNRGLQPSFSQNSLFSQSNGGTSSSSLGGQQQMDNANLYSLTNEGGAAQGGGVTLENTLAYGYQPVSGIGNQRNQEQSGDASDNNNRASLLATGDYGAEQTDQTTSHDQRALYAAALAAAAARNQAPSNYYQTSAANGQDYMQPAATSNQNMIRQHQLSQLTAAILSRNPSLSSTDLNSLLQRYQQQQQQRLLATQLQLQLQQQQQQQQQAQQQQKQISSYQSVDSAGFLPGYSSTRDQVIYRRYSPDSGIVTGGPYVSARSVQSGAESGQLAASGDLVPYSTTSQFQPVYSRTGGEANLAYYQAALAAAAAAAANAKTNSPSQLQMDQQSSLMSVTSPYLSQQSTGQQQHYATALGGSSNNYSAGNGGGSLYATSAMNSPAFAVYTTDPVAAGQHLKPISTSPASPTTSALGSNQQAQQTTQQTAHQQQQQQQYSTTPYKKSYLNSLFKPTASSRYYYTPTILSPISYDPTPTSMHSLYTPASLASASEQMQAQITSLPQMYAATAAAPANPYLQHATSLSNAGFTAADQAQQYQAYAAAAAAAAANGLHPQYMTDPDMAESSMVPTDTSNTFADATTGQGMSSGGGGGSSSSDDNNSNNGNSNNGSVSKSGKSMGPWSNIATLMLGILPLGILMSYLMPAVTIAGRKKRELELSGRNFSELLKWRPPSSVLNALMSGGSGQESGSSKASAIISELISSIAPGKLSSSSSVDNGQQQYNKRRSLVERPSLTQRKSSWDKLMPQQHQTSPTSGVTMKSSHHSNDLSSPTTNTESTTDPTTHIDTKSTLDSTATTLNSPSSSTTPLPPQQQQLLSQANNNSASGVKGKFKKAMNALNNFIVAASANMKRKHRSSMIENHWSIPSIIKSSLKLDNLFNVQELKRQLVEKAKEIQFAQSQMAQQQYSLLGKHQSAPADQSSFSQRTSSNSMFSAPLMTTPTPTTTTATNSPSVTKSNQIQASQIISNSTSPQQAIVTAVTTDLTSEDVTASSQLELPVTSSSVVVPKVQYQINQPEMTVAHHQDTTYNPKLSVISSKSLFVTDQQTTNNEQQQPVVNLNTDKAADMNNSTRNHLEVCLNQFLCRLTVKLSKSLKNTYITKAQTGSGDHNNKSPSSNAPITPDHVEKLTKKYINQLVEQIETENPSLKLNSKMYHQETYDTSDDEQQQRQQHHHHHWNNTGSENPLDVLYKNAMKNQCSIMYNCIELIQLEKTLSKMKLKLS